eukprot:gene5772-6477_t
MSALNIVFSNLEKFTGNGNINLNQWLKSFERCCVIADKKDDLVLGQILMLCVDGRAKACLDQFEDAKDEPQKLSVLKKQLQEIFDSASDREAKMSDFEQRIQRVNKSEEEFMTSLLQTFRAANPSAKDEEIDRAVKRKFLQGIILAATPLADPTLDAIMMLSSKFDEQAKITQMKLETQQDEINALKRQLPPSQPTPQYPQPNRQQRPRFTPNSYRQFPRSAAQFQSGDFPRQQASDATPRCHFCHGLNHFKRDCLAFKRHNQPNQQSENFWGSRGSALNSLRPVTALISLIDGHQPFEARLRINILPTIQVISHQNACTEVLVINNSPVSKTIGKGTKIATGTCAFQEITSESLDNVNLLSPSSAQPPPDCVAILTRRMQHLSPPQLQQATQLLTEFRDVFSLSNSKIGRANQPILKELLNHYQDLGLIEHIDSPYRAATLLVEKKNVANSAHVTDRYRLVVDYRFLNNAFTDSGWPAPSLQQCLDSVTGSTFVSSIDFNSGYHQIPCTDHCKPLLAFSPGYGFGQWTWTVMPQGIKPASNHFQKTMEQTFSDLSDCILPPFFDDVVIKGTSFQEHLCNIRRVLTRLREVGLTLNALKCRFFQTKLPYLGHIIDCGQIRLDPARVQSLVELPAPKIARKLKEFLGMAQFCDRFLPHYSEIASPLYHLTEINAPFHWTPECDTAFNTIKHLLTNAPLVRAPDSGDFFILETDASDKGEGVCLKARSYADGKEYIVAYASRKFNITEAKWNIVEKEAHAIIFATQKFRHYLFGKPFLLRTDNRVNTYLQSKRSPKSRKLLNWALELSEFDYEIHHIPSKNNAISDCLSRMYSINIIDMDLQPEFNTEELIEHQSKDPAICAAKEYLLSKTQFDISRLGSLQRYRKHLTLSTEGILQWKSYPVIPEQLRSTVLRICHDHASSGHFGIDRTWTRLSNAYFWPNARHDVHNWVKSCHTCSSFNSPPQGYHKAPLQPIESSERFQLVCYDLAGPFIPASDNGNTYALILVDHFTKWLEVIPLKDTRAPTIALAIHNQWICRYGLMQRLHSDGAPNVDGCIMHEVCNILGIGKSKSSRLHPQGDGLSEAMVKQVKACIQKQVDIHGRNWDTHLQAAAYAIRTSVNTSTNVTPAELVFGAKISTPIQLLTTSSTRPIPPSLPHHVKQAQHFANELGENLKKTVSQVQASLAASRNKMKKQYDTHAKAHHYQVHDTVMLWHPNKKKGISRCWQPNWSGPWTITRLIGDLNCQLANAQSKATPVVHVNQLKYIAPRFDHLKTSSRSVNSTPPQPQPTTTDIFESLVTDQIPNNTQDEPNFNTNREGNVEMVQNRNVGRDEPDSVAPVDEDLPIITGGWCNMNQGNIIEQRTRSQSVT